MNYRNIYFTLFLIFVTVGSFAQISIGNGNHVLEITGTVGTYYGYRSLADDIDEDDTEDYKKNRFKLKDAQIQFEGRIGNDYEYELQFDIADFAAGTIDPEDPGLMDAYILYKGFDLFDIKMGYGKVPYSRSSMVPAVYTAMFNRAELVRGDIFPRRDVGVTLSKTMWKQRINTYFGAYTGLGERSLEGNNDASGTLEYIARVDVSYPSRYRYRDIDNSHSPVPVFSVGVNARYADKETTTGSDYYMKTIDGEKITYGFDFSAKYQGLSFQYELHQIRMEPNTPEKFLGYDTDYVMAGGWYSQLNYCSKKMNTIATVRYEEFNQNDLDGDVSSIFAAGLSYMVDGFNSMIKIQYKHIVDEEILSYQNGFKWTDEFKIGWVLMFK